MSFDHAEQTSTKRQGWTKARAVLAGGLVLGVGAAITLAAWTDNEWARGLFGSGTFGIEGSTDGAAFSEHPTSGSPAQLNFAVGADNLAPSSEVYAGFAVRLESDSTYAATVDVAQDTSDALAGTTASYVYTTDATCDANAYAAGTNPNGASFELDALDAPAFLCFKVAAGSTLAQGANGSITWTFTAESGATL
ncbi:MAG: SipW-dependent-type signal peptide-containing protein [Leucobacter sp.]|nr:SipW-dependent-type signal peptide-containing protein [Leucobacter sp.]